MGPGVYSNPVLDPTRRPLTRTRSIFGLHRSQAPVDQQPRGGRGTRGQHEAQVRGVLVRRDVHEPLAPAPLRQLRRGTQGLGDRWHTCQGHG